MKKFYFLLLALIVSAVSASAQLYFRGTLGNWGTDYPMEQNGTTWTVTIPELFGQFKISDADWTDTGTYGVQKGLETSLSGNPAEMSLVKGNNSDNISIHEGERWINTTITFDTATNTLTVNAASVEPFDGGIDIFLHGQFDGSIMTGEGSFSDYKLIHDGEGLWHVDVNTTRSSGEFGFRRMYAGSQTGWWAYGIANTTIELGKEYSLTKQEGANNLKYSLNSGKSYRFYLTGTKDTGFKVRVEEIADIYVVGKFNEWSPENSTAMTQDNGFYILEYTGRADENNIKFSTAKGDWDTFNNNVIIFNGTWEEGNKYQIEQNQTYKQVTDWTNFDLKLMGIKEGHKYLIRIKYSNNNSELAVYELTEHSGLTTGTLDATADDALGFTLSATATDATLNGRAVADMIDYTLDLTAPEAAWMPSAKPFAFGETTYSAACPGASHTLTLSATPVYGKLTQSEFASLNMTDATASVTPRLSAESSIPALSVIDIEALTNERHLGHHSAAPTVYDRINTFSTDITLPAIEGITFATADGSPIAPSRAYSVDGYNALSATPELPLTISRGNKSTSTTIALPAYSSDETAFPEISSVSAAHTMLFFGDATGYPAGTSVYDFAIDYRFSFGTSTPAAAGYIGYKADIEGRSHSAGEGNEHKFGGYVAPQDEVFFAGSADNVLFRGIENYVYGAGDWARLCAESGRLPLHISDFGHGEGTAPTVKAAFNIIYPLLNAPAVTEKAEAAAMTAAPRRARAISLDDIVAHNPAVAEDEDPYSADNAAATAEPITPEDYTTTGIGNVAVDTDAPAEYYNLQGVRIARPAAGSVCIVRRGNTVSKTIVR